MKKIYFLILLCIASISGFATTWYSQGTGDPSQLSNWNSLSGGGGSSPLNFTSAGDTFIMQTSMSGGSGTWTLGTGTTLQLNSVTFSVHFGTINCYNLYITGSSYWSGQVYDYVYISGNFSLTGTSYMSNPPDWNYLYFVGPSSAASPQLCTITTTSSGSYTYLYENSGAYVQLTANSVWNQGDPFTVYGGATFDCAGYTWGGNQTFTLSSGATLYTGMPGGINAALTTSGTKTLSSSASYGFDGNTAQVTGALLPTSISSPGQIIINNSAGVTLSQNTTVTTTSGALTFLNGTLNTGGNTLTVPGVSGAVTGAGTNNYVIGNLVKTISGNTVINYEVGDADYAPMQLTLSSAGTAGSLGVMSTAGLHPSATSSGFGTSNMVNHYWTISNSSAAGPSTVTPKATYNLGDILGGSNNSFYTQEYVGGAWLSNPITSTNTSAPYTTTPNSGIALSTLAGDYIFGATVPYAYASPTSLSYGIVGIGASSVLSTTIAGGNLLAGPLTVTAPSNFQVSTSATGPWSSSTTVSYTPPALGSTIIYVQFNPTASTTYTGNVTVTGGGISSLYNIAVTGIGQPPCSGTPTAGTATATPTSGNAGTAFTLSLTGATAAAGLTYQWQSSPDNITWTNIYGATSYPYSFSGLTGNTYFRCIVSCGAFSANSSSQYITTTGAAASSCTPSSYYSPCTYYAGTSGNPVIINGVSGSISDASPCGSGTGGSPYYYNNVSMSVSFYQGGSYSSTIGSGYYYTSGQVWIDFNDDGVFQASETVGGYQKANCCTTSPRQTPTLTIPANATPGAHRMRVVNGYTLYYAPGYSSTYPSYPQMNPCPNTTSTQYYMDSRDYTAVILVAPAAVTTSASTLAFGNVTTGTSSNPPQFFTLTGTNLFGAPVTVTPPANFSVSLDGVTWSTSPISVGYTPGYPVGNMSPTNVYVQFNPSAASSYSGNITISGAGLASSVTVAVSGTGTSACSGAPTAGTVAASPTSGNGATTFTLSLTGASASGNMLYQWQSSPTGSVWTNIPGGVFPTYTFSGLGATTQYRCIVTCIGGASATSSPVTVTYTGGVHASSCTPSSYFSACTYYVGTTGNPVTISGASGTSISDASPCGSGTGGSSYYYNNTTMSVTFNQGGSYASTIGSGYYYNSGQIWIDFNDDGIFQTTETVGGYNKPTCCTVGPRATPTINIPANATPGPHRMRVMNGYSSFYGPGYSTSYPTYPQMNPCPYSPTTVYYADTRDYTAVIALPACSGVPNPGIVTVAGTTVSCSPFTTTVINVGENTTSGISYQWQSSTSPLSGFTNIAGATNSVYTPSISTVGTVYYRQNVTCANSGKSAASLPTQGVTLNPLPTAITGSLAVCNGSSGTLASTPAGGTWSSNNISVASIGSASGLLSGVAVGNATVTYTLPTTCYITALATVNPLPAGITGTTTVCQGAATILSDATTGGSWSSSDATIASFGTSGGTVTGVSGGFPTVTYTLPTGCIATTSMTVNGTSPISGVLSLCSGYGTTLTDAITGGTWVSGNPIVAVIGSSSGVVTSYTSGTSIITYTNPNGCTVTAILGVVSTPNVYSITGGGNICPGSGAHIYVNGSDFAVDYQLYRNGVAVGSVVTGTGSAIDMGLQTSGGTYTVVAQPGSPCQRSMIGSLLISVLPAPTAYNVTGGGGYCSGSTGVHVGLNGSDAGFTYQLYNGTSTVGYALSGTGTIVDFGALTGVGTYTVMATNTATGCTGGMTGNAVVSINPPPTAYNMTGGGGYCIGGAGVTVGLANSATGVNYQLYNGSTPVGSIVSGIGGAISFGTQTVAGTYTVVGTNTVTGCTGNMAGSKTVTVNPLPIAYSVTGGGSYCSGGTGVHIGLSGSESGVTYKLYIGGVSTTTTASGTGGAIDFGAVTAAGTYTVVASNATTGCTNNMTGSASVTINALPTAYGMTGGGAYCQGGSGVHVGLNGSDLGTTYYLYRAGSILGGASGTTAALDFGLETLPGIYTIVATNTATGCSNSMTSSVTVVENLLPTLYTLTGGGSYCAGGTGLAIGLSSSDANITYKLYNGGIYTGTGLTGIGTALNFGTFTSGGTYTVTASDNITGCLATMTGSSTITVNPLPTVYNVTGGGNYCTGGTGVHVGLNGSDLSTNYKLMKGGTTVTTIAGSGGTLDFGLETATGTYTVVANNTSTGCISNMAGSPAVAINPLPSVYTVGGGGSYCAGGAGLAVTLNNSVSGINYQLYRGTTAIGGPVAGTGSSLNFGLQTTSGTYTVVAANASTGCNNNMSGSAAIAVTAAPAAFSVTGGGSYCSGGTGMHVGLSNSTSGVNYQLYNGSSAVGSAIAGSGLAIDFGAQSVAGSYTVIATSGSTGCSGTMTGSANIAINPLPASYAVTGGGGYCAGTTGVHTGLTSSATGVSYQLYIGSAAIGSPVSGSGSALDFGLQTTAGTYTAVATNTATGCSSNMTGSTTVAVNPLPTVHAVTGGGNYCIGGSGVSVGLDGTSSGINYQLYLGSTAAGSPMSGSGPAISFGLQTTTGTYTVVATNTATGCSSNMTGSATVTSSATPIVYAVTGGGNYCASGSGVTIGLGGSDPGISYQLYHGSAVGTPVVGTGSAISFGPQTTAGSYTVVAAGSTAGCVATMSGSATVAVNTPPAIHSITGGGSYCAGGNGVGVGLSVGDAGVNYQLYNGTTAAGAPIAGTGTALSFGLQIAAGTYTVKATDATTGCTSNMSGSAAVAVDAVPASYNMTGGGGYCAGGTGRSVQLAGSQPGINYQLYQGATAIGSAVAGTGSSLDFGLQPAGVYTVSAVNPGTFCQNDMAGSTAVYVNALPVTYAMTGGGAYCAGGPGLDVQLGGSAAGVSYQLYSGTATVGSPIMGNGAAIDFGLLTTSGAYTVAAMDTATGCVSMMTGAATVIANPLPSAYGVISSGSSYCAGGTGVTVGLLNTQSGVDYQLYHNGVALGSPVHGVSGPLSLGAQTLAGVYTVNAVNATTGCSAGMAGSATISINPAPAVYTVTGGGSYCSGGTGVHVGVSGSTSGMQYQLYQGGTAVGSPVTATGGVLDLGLQTAAGNYTIVASDPATGCTSNMTGSATVGINASPVSYTVTGGGSYCAGGAGVNVGLMSSATGIQYQLRMGTANMGSSVAGTGSAIDFGHQSAAGVYTVVATNALSGCNAAMSGSATVAMNAAPATHTVTGGGGYCAGGSGVHIGLSTADAGISYQLYNGTTTAGSAINGSGSVLDFGAITSAGTYTVLATDSISGCTRTMSGTATVNVNAVPVSYAITGGGAYCAGGTGVHVGLGSSATGVDYTLNRGTAITTMHGTGSTLDFGLQTASGAYTVTAANAVTGCSSNMTGSATVSIAPVVIPAVTISTPGGNQGCSGRMSHFTATPANGGSTPLYQWYVNGVASGSSASIFNYMPADGDVVSVKMTSNAACTSPASATNDMTMSVNSMETPAVAITSDHGSEVCSGTTVTFTAVALYGGSAPSYVWLKNGVADTASTTSTFTYAPASGDNITCVLHSGYYCRISDTAVSNQEHMTTVAPQTPSVTISSSVGNNVTAGAPVTLTAQVTNVSGTVAYQWYVNGGIIAGATLPVYTSSNFSDGDAVSCTVTTSGICSGVTGSGSLTLHVWNVGVSQVTKGSSDIRLAPNPNKGTFTIKGNLGIAADQEVTIEITDMLGQVVYNSKVTARNGDIDAQIQLGNTLANGMYILNLHTDTDNKVFHVAVEQ